LIDPPTLRVPEAVKRILLRVVPPTNVMLPATVAVPVEIRIWPTSLPFSVNVRALQVNVPASTERLTVPPTPLVGVPTVAVPETLSALVLSVKLSAALLPASLFKLRAVQASLLPDAIVTEIPLGMFAVSAAPGKPLPATLFPGLPQVEPRFQAVLAVAVNVAAWVVRVT
jgi:hypothetical protein